MDFRYKFVSRLQLQLEKRMCMLVRGFAHATPHVKPCKDDCLYQHMFKNGLKWLVLSFKNQHFLLNSPFTVNFGYIYSETIIPELMLSYFQVQVGSKYFKHIE